MAVWFLWNHIKISLLVNAIKLFILWIIPWIAHKYLPKIQGARCWADTNMHNHIMWKWSWYYVNLVMQEKNQMSLSTQKSISFHGLFPRFHRVWSFLPNFFWSQSNVYFQRPFLPSCFSSSFALVPDLTSQCTINSGRTPRAPITIYVTNLLCKAGVTVHY